jgi:ABC-type cobalamin/Fe3+-siderophores transport system ATPase subunit
MPNKNYSAKEILSGTLINWFNLKFDIEYQGDKIHEMSPGKKSFVLLRLLIELDNSKCPILIDQPEDDLDNRSITNDVVEFLKEAKKERQIIIATHNPNLVVGSDSELIIVSNQNGEGTKNREKQFEYTSGSIEHTFPKRENITAVLYQQGIKEHICDILEGGELAFKKRQSKYNFHTN